LLIITVSTLICLFFPFTKTTLTLDFKLNYKARNEVVELIKTGELKPEETNERLITLPGKYERLSKGGGEVVIEHFSDHDVYLFFTFRGILDNYSGFVYDSNENAWEELSRKYFEVVKLDDSWFFCASR